uniref:Uncharacterized protein n=1 Tax=Anguilla anguilla TaxID=7936 RepID=A0A0E9X4E8_ANGAN
MEKLHTMDRIPKVFMCKNHSHQRTHTEQYYFYTLPLPRINADMCSTEKKNVSRQMRDQKMLEMSSLTAFSDVLHLFIISGIADNSQSIILNTICNFVFFKASSFHKMEIKGALGEKQIPSHKLVKQVLKKETHLKERHLKQHK